MPEGGSETSTVPVVWVNFGIFSTRSKWFPVAIGDHGRNVGISLWLGHKATINGLAALWLTPPLKIPSPKIRWKSSRLDFLGSRRHPPHRLSSKRPNYQRGILLISADATEGQFEWKTLDKRLKWIELCGEYVEQIPSLVAVACFLPDRAKDLSAPHVYKMCILCLLEYASSY